MTPRPSQLLAPTRRALWLFATALPIAVVFLIWAPAMWWVAPLWCLLVLGAVLVDAGRAGQPSEVILTSAREVGVGDPMAVTLRIEAASRLRRLSATLALDGALADGGRAAMIARDRHFAADLHPLRRGRFAIDSAWLSWLGPAGLARRGAVWPLNAVVAVLPSVRRAHEVARRWFDAEAMLGQRLVARIGEGSEFESLDRYQQGLEARRIDWKQSARHTELLVRQFETERDARILLLIDAGRTMTDPLPLPDGRIGTRLDAVISAALGFAYVALRAGDRISFGHYAERPRIDPRQFTRPGELDALRRAAAEVEYGAVESNVTLGLAAPSSLLRRRTLILLFTEITDAAGAALMLKGVQRMTRDHLVMFVLLADPSVESVAAAAPHSLHDVAAATIAADLLRDRRQVIVRLRQLGAIVVEAGVDGLTDALIQQWIDIKRKGRL